MKFRIYALAMIAAMGLTAANASAAVLACPASWSADGAGAKIYYPTLQTAASGCHIDTATSNDNDNNPSGPDAGNGVNVYAYFGFSDWDRVAKSDTGGLTGTWSIPTAQLNFLAFDYMLIFKNGNGTNLVGFFLNEEASSGSWKTPFLNPPFSFNGAPNGKEVSHVSVYRRTAQQQVPEPGSLMLLVLGLLGVSGFSFLAQRARA